MPNSNVKERFGALLTSAGQMYWEVDKDFTVTFANDLFKEVFGDPTGKKCHEFVNKRPDVCPDCLVEKVFQGADRAVGEGVRYDRG